MRKLIILVTFAIATCSTLTSCRTLPLAAAIRSSPPNISYPKVSQKGKLANNRPPLIDASSSSCAKPRPDSVPECDRLEQQILASTVRLVWHRRLKNNDGRTYTFVDGGIALATIKEGRYLVTHNHSGISSAALNNRESITGFVSTATGELIWLGAPLEAITTVVEVAETLVLDFGSDDGRGFFESMGLSSVEFKAWESLPLQSGMEVAQVDWDGQTAQVDWATIDKVIIDNGTPRLELANVVAPGASGGGVFWNGYHIANTWSRVTVSYQPSGAILDQFSVAALNSARVSGQLR
jgi:hypothetical protein